MPTTALPAAIVIAYHGTEGTGGPMVLLILLGALITAGWLLLSQLRWRNTVLVAVAGWVVGLSLAFLL